MFTHNLRISDKILDNSIKIKFSKCINNKTNKYKSYNKK